MLEHTFEEDWKISAKSNFERAISYDSVNTEFLMLAEEITKIETVLDLGCGPDPASNELIDRKFISIDEKRKYNFTPSYMKFLMHCKSRLFPKQKPIIKRTLLDKDNKVYELAKTLGDKPNAIQFDLNNLANRSMLSKEFKDKVLAKRWNLIIASNILNYVNWKVVIKELSQTQESKDTIHINNRISRGYKKYFHQTSPSPEKLITCLENNRYKIVKKEAFEHNILAKKRR